MVVTGAEIAVYGVLTSSGPTDDDLGTDANSSVELRSTNTANRTSELLVPPIVTTTTANTFIVYDPPVIAKDGLCLRNSTSAIMSAVFYRLLASTQNTWADVRIPMDDYQQKKVHDSGLYGVNVATTVIAGGIAGDGSGSEQLDMSEAELLVSGSSASITSILQRHDRVPSTEPSTTTLRGERGLWYGWSAGSGTSTNYLIVSDTATATGNAKYMLPPIFYRQMTLALWNLGSGANHLAVNFKWPWPVIYEYGLLTQRECGDTLDTFRIYRKPAKKLR